MIRLWDLHSYLFLKTTIIIVLYVCNGDWKICQPCGKHIQYVFLYYMYCTITPQENSVQICTKSCVYETFCTYDSKKLQMNKICYL